MNNGFMIFLSNTLEPMKPLHRETIRLRPISLNKLIFMAVGLILFAAHQIHIVLLECRLYVLSVVVLLYIFSRLKMFLF